MPHAAACNCGQLRLTCEGQPVRVSMCHCLECQRRTGAVLSVSGAPERSSATKHGSNGSKLLQSQATQLNSRAYQTPGAR